MIHAAVLGAEEMVTPGLRRFEPFGGVAAGHDVGFNPKCRNKDVMNYILRSHDQFDLAADGYVQFVDLTLTGGMLKLPHPLFADNVDFNRVLRRPVLVKINFRSPKKDTHRNQQRNYRPERFQLHRAFDGARNFEGIAAPVFHDKENDDERNQQREKDRHARDIEIQRIDIARIGRRAFWNKWKPGLHGDQIIDLESEISNFKS